MHQNILDAAVVSVVTLVNDSQHQVWLLHVQLAERII